MQSPLTCSVKLPITYAVEVRLLRSTVGAHHKEVEESRTNAVDTFVLLPVISNGTAL